jgi:hypothetical protein
VDTRRFSVAHREIGEAAYFCLEGKCIPGVLGGRALQIEPGKAKNEEKAPYRIYIAVNEYIDAKEPHSAIVFLNCD